MPFPARALQAQVRRAVILSDGELTVTLCGKGRGGPNQEGALALALVCGGRGALRPSPGYLDDNNSTEFFEKLGDLLVSGPTLTNVNDFRAIVVDSP
jgi:glycerate 2-kinase